MRKVNTSLSHPEQVKRWVVTRRALVQPSRHDAIDTCYDAIETCYDAIDTCYDAIETCYGAIDTCYDAIETCYGAIETCHRRRLFDHALTA